MSERASEKGEEGREKERREGRKGTVVEIERETRDSAFREVTGEECDAGTSLLIKVKENEQKKKIKK